MDTTRQRQETLRTSEEWWCEFSMAVFEEGVARSAAPGGCVCWVVARRSFLPASSLRPWHGRRIVVLLIRWPAARLTPSQPQMTDRAEETRDSFVTNIQPPAASPCTAPPGHHLSAADGAPSSTLEQPQRRQSCSSSHPARRRRPIASSSRARRGAASRRASCGSAGPSGRSARA